MFREKDQQSDKLATGYQGKCPVCGGQDFEWGRSSAYFIPTLGIWKSQNYQYIKIRRCTQCNNLMQFTDADLTKRLKGVMFLVIAIAVIGLLLAAVVLPILTRIR